MYAVKSSVNANAERTSYKYSSTYNRREFLEFWWTLNVLFHSIVVMISDELSYSFFFCKVKKEIEMINDK